MALSRARGAACTVAGRKRSSSPNLDRWRAVAGMLKHYGAVAGVVGGVTLLQFANTMLSVVLPLQLALAGYSGTTAGLVVSGYGVGFLIGCLITPRLIRDVGHIRAFAVLAALCSVTSMVFAAGHLVRALVRAAGADGLLPGWLVHRRRGVAQRCGAVESTRRRAVLLFGATKVAIVGAQLLIGQFGTVSAEWFRGRQRRVHTVADPGRPHPHRAAAVPAPPAPGAARAIQLAPAAVAGCLASGLMNSALLGLTPIFGTRQGLSPAFVVWLLTAFQLGSFVLPVAARPTFRSHRSTAGHRRLRRLWWRDFRWSQPCRVARPGLAVAGVFASRREHTHLLRGGGGARCRLRRAGPDGRRQQQPAARMGGGLRGWTHDRRTVHRPDRSQGPVRSTVSSSPPASPAFVLWRMTRRAAPPRPRRASSSCPPTTPRVGANRSAHAGAASRLTGLTGRLPVRHAGAAKVGGDRP